MTTNTKHMAERGLYIDAAGDMRVMLNAPVAKTAKTKRTGPGPEGWLRRCARQLERSAPHVSLVWNGHRQSAVLMTAIREWRAQNGLK